MVNIRPNYEENPNEENLGKFETNILNFLSHGKIKENLQKVIIFDLITNIARKQFSVSRITVEIWEEHTF
jgi:aryl-phospho-beta-D-glucosidase BglC (GH1 family)